MRQVSATCRSRLCDLYWVRTTIFCRPEFTRFDSAKSMRRKFPPNGTAGFARSAVSGMSRLPSPPASTMPKIFFGAMPLTVGVSTGNRYYVDPVRVDVLTREYPPEVYGGAGVHVPNSPRRCGRGRTPTCRVRAFGASATKPTSGRTGRRPGSSRRTARCRRSAPTCRSLHDVAGADLVHSHTWYANCGGPDRAADCTASPTSSPRTASSRCVRGRPSSSAAATGCRAG